MSYATPDQVRGVLTLDPEAPLGTAAELGDPALTEHISAAAAEVDASLCARYQVPFDPTPRLVGDITVAIAAYLATLTYRRTVDLTEKDPVYLRYQWAKELLAKLQSGELDLPEENGIEPSSQRGQHVVNTVPSMFGLRDFDLTYGRSGRVRTDPPRYGW